jgi:hypothetical protein
MPTEASPASPGASSYAETGLSLEQASALDFDDTLDGADPANPDDEEQSEVEDDQADPKDPDDDESDEDGSEDEDPDDKDDDGQPKPRVLEPTDLEALVTLPDGTQSTVAELVNGNLRERDYRMKTAEVGEARRSVIARSNQVEGVFEALVDHLAQHLPDEPDRSLLFSQDPNVVASYHQAKAMHEAAMEQLASITQMKAQATQAKEQGTAEQRAEKYKAENAALIAYMPELGNPKKREELNAKARAAAKHLGFNDQEINGNTDSRFYLLSHFAFKGLESESRQKNASKKVQNVPPVQSLERRAQKPGEQRFRKQKERVARLVKSGSLKDALAVDIEF